MQCQLQMQTQVYAELEILYEVEVKTSMPNASIVADIETKQNDQAICKETEVVPLEKGE